MAGAQARPGAPAAAVTGSVSVRRRQWLAARAAAAAVRAPAAAAAALAATVLGTAPAMAATAARAQAPASAATTPATVKYYIVPPAAGGSVPTLYSIAATTLGNGSLYMEIFKLNKGRLQPNGQRLANPHSVEPGWILLLPPGASGPGVHSGPLPAAAKATSRDARRASPRRQARAAASPAAAGAGHGSGTIAEPVIGGALLVFAVAGLGLVVRRRRRAGGGNQRKPTYARAAGPGSDWVRGLAADPPGEVGAMPYTDHTNGPASDPGRPVGAPAYQGRPADSDGQDWPYPDHPAWPAGGQGRPLTPDHPSWPATDLGRPVGTAVGSGRPAGADRPGWPYPDHPSWPASDLGRPLAGDDYPSWPAAEPGGGGAGPGRPPARPGGPPPGEAGLPQRQRLSAAPAPAVHHDPNPRQPVPQVPPAHGRHVRVPVGYSSHPGPADDTPQRWSAQLARTTGPIPQTYYELAFGDGRLQVMLTEPPAPARAGQPGMHATCPGASAVPLGGPPVARETEELRQAATATPSRWRSGSCSMLTSEAAEIQREAAAQATAIRQAAEAEAAEIREQAAALHPQATTAQEAAGCRRAGDRPGCSDPPGRRAGGRRDAGGHAVDVWRAAPGGCVRHAEPGHARRAARCPSGGCTRCPPRQAGHQTREASRQTGPRGQPPSRPAGHQAREASRPPTTKPVSRQSKVMRKMAWAIAAVSVIGAISGTTELALHGGPFFVLRANGAGAGETGPKEPVNPELPQKAGEVQCSLLHLACTLK